MLLNLKTPHFQVFSDSAKILSKGQLRSKTLQITSLLDYGYRLMDASEIVPTTLQEKLLLKRSPSATAAAAAIGDKSGRLNGAKHATRSIDLDHKIFFPIYKLLQQLTEFAGHIQNYYKFMEDDLKSKQVEFDDNILVYGAAFETIYGEKLAKVAAEFTTLSRHLTKMKDLTALLSEYYHRYMALVIEEFGDTSSFKSSQPSAEAYLNTFAELVGRKQPLLVAEKRPMVSTLSKMQFSSGT